MKINALKASTKLSGRGQSLENGQNNYSWNTHWCSHKDILTEENLWCKTQYRFQRDEWKSVTKMQDISMKGY